MKKNFTRIKRAKEGEIKSLSEVELKRWIGVTLRELIRLTRALGLLLLSHWAMMIILYLPYMMIILNHMIIIYQHPNQRLAFKCASLSLT